MSTRTESRAPVAAPAGLDVSAAYRALAARDRRFDGHIWFGVTTTGIYCRPVCPAQTPREQNVRFFASPAAAVSSGYRACRRCRPDAAPGSRHWDHRGDLAARALRLVAEGVVDEVGVSGLADTLHVSERHLHRVLVAEVGVGPLQLAVSRRAQTARLLVDQTELALVDVAYAAGFASVRQFNDVMRREFGVPPSALRGAGGRTRSAVPDGGLVLRLPWRGAYGLEAVGSFLAARTVPGLEVHHGEGGAGGWRHERALRLPHGDAVVGVSPVVAARAPSQGPGGHVVVRLRGADLRDTAAGVAAVRRWLDLDVDPDAVAHVLRADPLLAPLVAASPGVRVVTGTDPFEGAVRAVVGQQVTVAGGVTLLGRIAALAHGGDLDPEALVPFPLPADVARLGVDAVASLGMPRSRARSVVALAEAVAFGGLDLDPGADRDTAQAGLRALPGVGPWTAAYVGLRVIGDPDAFPAGDLVLGRAAQALGLAADDLPSRARRWRPWRAYAASLLWGSAPGAPSTRPARRTSRRPEESA